MWTPDCMHVLAQHGNEPVFLDSTYKMCEQGFVLHTLAVRHPKSKFIDAHCMCVWVLYACVLACACVRVCMCVFWWRLSVCVCACACTQIFNCVVTSRAAPQPSGAYFLCEYVYIRACLCMRACACAIVHVNVCLRRCIHLHVCWDAKQIITHSTYSYLKEHFSLYLGIRCCWSAPSW